MFDAKMKVWHQDQKVHCVYYPTHSHKMNVDDFVHHPLPEATSNFVNNDRLAWDVSPTKVFQTVRKNLVHSDSGISNTVTSRNIK